MSVYMISYDLKAPTKNRELVEKDIKSLGKCYKCVTTTFLVSTMLTGDKVQLVVSAHLDANDKLICCQIVKPVWGFMPKDEWNIINTNF